MERRHGQRLCALGGGIALGAGVAAWALCSPASVGCTTNVVILTGGRVTSKGCAAYSVAAHAGVGLVVLGAVLLVGRFLLARSARASDVAGDHSSDVVVRAGEPSNVVVGTERGTGIGDDLDSSLGLRAVAEAAEPVRTGYQVDEARAVGSFRSNGHDQDRRPTDAGGGGGHPGRASAGRDLRLIGLPPGWYGNPDNPSGTVLWWDGTRLLDERPSA